MELKVPTSVKIDFWVMFILHHFWSPLRMASDYRIFTIRQMIDLFYFTEFIASPSASDSITIAGRKYISCGTHYCHAHAGGDKRNRGFPLWMTGMIRRKSMKASDNQRKRNIDLQIRHLKEAIIEESLGQL